MLVCHAVFIVKNHVMKSVVFLFEKGGHLK